MLRNVFFLIIWISSSKALYTFDSGVRSLNSENFDRSVINFEGVYVVEFFAPWCGHCQRLVPEYIKAAKALNGIVKVGAVNIEENKELQSRFGVKGFPTIKIFGDNKYKPEDYSGPRTAKGIVDAALSAARKKANAILGGKISDSKVVELTDEDFDDKVLDSQEFWMVVFYAPWCGHCKKLLPQWEEAAKELYGKVKLGIIDATVNTKKAGEYQVGGYPTIKFFPTGKKNAEGYNYNSGHSKEDVVNFALDKLVETLPAPEVVQLLDAKTFEEGCQRSALCVISILPHIYDCQADCRNGYLNTLRDVSEKFKGKFWGWFWAEGGVQRDLENSLEIGGFGYPALAILSPKKLKYSLLRGSFSTEGINEFLREVSFGRGSSAPIQGGILPNITKTTAWDGKDAILPQEEGSDLNEEL